MTPNFFQLGFLLLILVLFLYLAIKGVRRGKVEYYVPELGLFPRKDGRPPARGTYDRRTQPWSYWVSIFTLVAWSAAILVLIFRDLSAWLG